MTEAQVGAFCEKWKLTRLGVFGSILRDDWDDESDVDLLIEFAPGVHWPWGGFTQMKDELEPLLGRRVDLVELAAVRESRNTTRKEHVLQHMQTLYAA